MSSVRWYPEQYSTQMLNDIVTNLGPLVQFLCNGVGAPARSSTSRRLRGAWQSLAATKPAVLRHSAERGQTWPRIPRARR